MNLFGYTIERKAQTLTLDQLIARLEAVHETASGIQVTAETCMESPTVRAIVTAISSRISTLPVHVLRAIRVNGRSVKRRESSHPVSRLLRSPNGWQTRSSYWLDATSWLVRHGNHYAYKARGSTGPIRRLESLPASSVEVVQREDMSLAFLIHKSGGGVSEYSLEEMHHVRGPARNGYVGDSPVLDVRESIALEIAAERFGGTFFGNGAMPSMVFGYTDGTQGFRSEEERAKFVQKFQESYGRNRRFRAMLLPKGIKVDTQVSVDNEGAQFLETRKYQRTVIAGAFGVPPHMVGDLESGTFNNVEQQSIQFIQGVVLPYVRMFEDAMERDLLTDEERRAGLIIRFNLDGALRGDFKTRQEGLKIQREAGVISPNDWRETENMNPIKPEQGGDTYWQQGPSGQGGKPPAEEGPAPTGAATAEG